MSNNAIKRDAHKSEQSNYKHQSLNRPLSHGLTDWDLFVLRHRKTPNIIMHVVSCFLFWLSPVLALFYSSWFWMGFFLSGLVGTLGHAMFKDSGVNVKEATASLQVVHFSTKMVFLFLIGRYHFEISQAQRKQEVLYAS